MRNRFQKISSIALGFILILIHPVSHTQALSPDQKRILDSGIYYFDFEATPFCSDFTGSVSSSLPSNVPEPYNQLLTRAAAAYNTHGQFLAAIYLSENGNVWKPFNTVWASSPKGASGPFQFMPGTWEGYAVDGNNDGAKDINNIYDAAFSAANLVSSYNARPNSQLGDLQQPLKTNTLLQIAASYNAGPGRVQQWGASAPLTTLYEETREYVSNIHSLLSSGFTKSGKPGYPDPLPKIGSSGATSATSVDFSSGCSSGVVAGSIVQTALNLAWETAGHGKEEQEAKPSYRTAMPQYNGSSGNDVWSDCGVFVSTVMRASGADPDYPVRLSAAQMQYVKNSPKYITFENIRSVDQLRPGDILVNTQHTYLFVGSPSGRNYNAVSASLGERVPQPQGTYFEQEGEPFLVARLK
ncbi:MAG: lytic transglycosylase domain-containing protein [Candidatus Saccharimonadales bacterium]